MGKDALLNVDYLLPTVPGDVVILTFQGTRHSTCST